MAYLRAVIALFFTLLACFVSAEAEAAYHYPKGPPGWRNDRPMSAREYAAQTVLDSITGRVIFAPNSLPVPVGGGAKLGVAYKLAPGAARVAAAAIFMHPGVRTAVAIASWLQTAKIVWDEASKTWQSVDPQDFGEGVNVSDGYQWRAFNSYWPEPKQKIFNTREQACDALLPYMNKGDNSWVYYLFSIVRESDNWYKCNFRARWHSDAPGTYRTTAIVDLSRVSGNCPVGWYITPAGCVQTPPPMEIGTKEQFTDKLAAKPMPETVPMELPKPTYLPVENPIVNPDPASSNPVSRPIFYPVSEPIKNPNYNPDAPSEGDNLPWLQPGIRVVHSPTAEEPFRLDLQPVNRPTSTGQGSGPVTETPSQSGTNPENENDKPREDQQDLCEKNPDIIACQKLEEPEEAKLPESEFEFSFTPELGFNGAASCPGPKVVTVSGKTLSFSWQPFCDSLVMAKPLLLAFAWLGAAFIILGARQET